MFTSYAEPKGKVRDMAQTKTSAKSNFTGACAGFLVFLALVGLGPPSARAATWNAAQTIFRLADGGTAKVTAKATPKAKPQAAPKVTATDLSVYQPTSYAVHTIPANYLNLCLKWGAIKKVDWRLGCSVLRTETNFGRDKLPGVTSGINFAFCCRGPGQFNTENHNQGQGTRIHVRLPNGQSYDYWSDSTWAHRKIDGNHDGVYNIFDPEDAVPSTFGFLASTGATSQSGWQHALWKYNKSTSYGLKIISWAHRLGVTVAGAS